MSVSETRPMPMTTAACLAVGITIGAAAISAVVGTNAVAKVVFGTLSVAGTSRLALLPLDYFRKEDRMEQFISHLKEAGLISGIAYGGLYALTDANLFHYVVPVVIATWLWAGPIVYRQGIVKSVGELKEAGRWRSYGSLHELKKAS